MEGGSKDYLEILLAPIRACKAYKPKFGQGSAIAGLAIEQFQELYRADPFYNWFGLDHPLMYAAHRAAGGMTSIYRQIGIGCERLFRAILRDALGLAEADVLWTYEFVPTSGKKRMIYLDGRVVLEQIRDERKRSAFRSWMRSAAEQIGVDSEVLKVLKGVVFEVRQGYKSKDSKRQKADIDNAAVAYSEGYLPCVVVLSKQIDKDILDRYRKARWLVLTGTIDESNATVSTYDFMRDIIGYDLAEFFKLNSEILRKEVESVLRNLLTPGNSDEPIHNASAT